MFCEKAGEILDSTIGEKIASKIEELIPILEDHLDMLEILSMIFPGRVWDRFFAVSAQGIFRKSGKICCSSQEKFGSSRNSGTDWKNRT